METPVARSLRVEKAVKGRANLIIVSMGVFMFRVRRNLSTSLALCLVLVLAGSLHAQIFPGRVTGTVLDSSGGAVEGAQVVLSAADIGLERSVKTDSSGGFHFQELPLATFKLTVTKSGFKRPDQHHHEVEPGERNQRDARTRNGRGAGRG